MQVVTETSEKRAARPEPTRRPRRALLALLAAGITTLFTILLAELALHIVNYPPQQTDHEKLFVEYDSVRGWRNIAGASGRYITEDYDVPLSYNSRGIRGAERPYAKPPGTYRIVLLGDSYIDGYSVPVQQRVSEVLESLLNAGPRARRTEVIALGTAGYSTDQELLWLEEEGLRYQPDVVVNMFYENDVWYNIQNRYWRGGKPQFVLQNDSLVLTNVPVPRAQLDARRNRHSLRDFIENNSRLYWLATAAIKKQPRIYALAVRWGLAAVPPEMVLDAGDQVAVPAEFNVYRTNESTDVALAWRVTQALLARMKRSSEAAGAQFLAFFIPFRGDIYTGESGVRSGGQTAAAGWDATLVARKFNQICRAEHLRCIDATERFRRAAAAKGKSGRLYYVNDWHWNAHGHALAAQILAEQVRPPLAAR